MAPSGTDTPYAQALTAAVAAAREAGGILRDELHRPDGPRCVGGDPRHIPVNITAETAIRARLLGAFSYGWLGEQTGEAAGTDPDHVWVVDPNNGAAEYSRGSRGSAVSIGLVCKGVPVLGVVYAMAYPDDLGELFAWAEGSGPVTVNDLPIENALAHGDLLPGATVIVSHHADHAPKANARCVYPGRYRPLPSIAHRLARVALGEAVAAVSLGGPTATELAAGHALLRAVGGVLCTPDGTEVAYDLRGGIAPTQSVVGGAPRAVHALLARPWQDVDGWPPRDAGTRVLVHPTHGSLARDPAALSRAQGCLLGQLAGDSLGARVEFLTASRIAAQHPHGVRDLADGGTWNILAGQPTDDSELALALARSIVATEGYAPADALTAYVGWYRSEPFDVGGTIGTALSAAAEGISPDDRLTAVARAASRDSQANGSLMRVSVLGIYTAGRPADGAALARADSGLTHPHPVCRAACSAYVSAISVAIAGGSLRDVYTTALATARGADGHPDVVASLVAAETSPPSDYLTHLGWVRVALHNAFYQLLHASDAEAAIVDTVGRGGDTDTNAAIVGALVGAAYGRQAIPRRWRDAIAVCRPLAEAGAIRPRPATYWPVDALELAERLLWLGRVHAVAAAPKRHV